MDTLEQAVEKAVARRVKGTWMQQYNTAPRADLVALGEGALEVAHKRVMRGEKYLNSFSDDEQAEIAAIWAERVRRQYRAKLAREHEAQAAFAAVEQSGQWPDGSPLPRVGQVVNRLYPGLFGMPFSVSGTVYRAKGGLRVRINPGQAVSGAKTVGLDRGWK